MSKVDDAVTELAAGEQQIEDDIAELRTAVLNEVADTKDEITKLLENSMTNPGLVTQVKDKLAALHLRVKDITASAKAADPGPQATEPPPVVEPPVVVEPPPVVEPPVDVPTGGDTPATS